MEVKEKYHLFTQVSILPAHPQGDVIVSVISLIRFENRSFLKSPLAPLSQSGVIKVSL